MTTTQMHVEYSYLHHQFAASKGRTKDILAGIAAVVERGDFTLGREVREFEEAFARYCGTNFAVACSSGTAGLHLLVRAASIGDGDEVITTPFSFIASANAPGLVTIPRRP